ncbi:MAG: hypothetical protein CMH83_11225 [Nocardioides sp.]|nr:hypothetical protein [Nocardioides sp.]
MATPGWYPDPAGQPGAFRFWDGSTWTDDLADHPYGPPPGGASTPPPPPPPGAPGGGYAGGWQDGGSAQAPTWQGGSWSSQPGQPGQPGQQPGQPGQYPSYAAGGSSPSMPGGPGGRRTGLVVAGLVVAVLLLGVVSFLVVRGLVDDDAGTAAGDPTTSQAPTPEATEEPSETPSAPESTEPTPEPTQPSEEPSTGGGTSPTELQCAGGLPTNGEGGEDGRFLVGGGLRMPKVTGFDVAADAAGAFTFADGVIAPSMAVTDNWIAVYALGSLPKANGYDSLEQSAETVVQCMTGSDLFYRGFSGREDLASGDLTVDGADAWAITTDITVDDPEVTVRGDRATIVVVDTGDADSYGVFVSVVPLDDQAMADEQDVQVTKLRLQ